MRGGDGCDHEMITRKICIVLEFLQLSPSTGRPDAFRFNGIFAEFYIPRPLQYVCTHEYYILHEMNFIPSSRKWDAVLK